MDNVKESVQFVKKYEALVTSQIEHHQRALKKATNTKSTTFHQSRVERWKEFLADLTSLQSPPPSVSSSTEDGTQSYSLRPKDILGLPDELLQELNFDSLEFAILDVMEKAGGVLSLERIITDYYREKNEILKRNQLSPKLYRMCRKGVISIVAGRKAVYTLDVPEGSKSGDIDDPLEEDDDLGS